MRDILNKIGATTRATVIGIGMGVVTLAVGAGIVFNAMDGGSGSGRLPSQLGSGYSKYSDTQYGTGAYGSGEGVRYGSGFTQGQSGSASALSSGVGDKVSVGRDTYGKGSPSYEGGDIASSGYENDIPGMDTAENAQQAKAPQDAMRKAMAAQADAATKAKEAAEKQAAEMAKLGQGGNTLGAKAGSTLGVGKVGGGSAGAGGSGFSSPAYAPQFSNTNVTSKGTDKAAKDITARNLPTSSSDLANARRGRVVDTKGSGEFDRGATGVRGQYGAGLAGDATNRLAWLEAGNKKMAGMDVGKIEANEMDYLYSGTDNIGVQEVQGTSLTLDSGEDTLKDYRNKLNPAGAAGLPPVGTDTKGSGNMSACTSIAVMLAAAYLGLKALMTASAAIHTGIGGIGGWPAAIAIILALGLAMWYMLSACKAFDFKDDTVAPAIKIIALTIGAVIIAGIAMIMIAPYWTAEKIIDPVLKFIGKGPMAMPYI